MRRFERIMKQHPEIDAWLKNRPENTQKAFAENLMNFCNALKIAPEEWRRLDKFEARDLAWRYVEPLSKRKSSVATAVMSSLKSWYRNLNGEKLPFDSGRGGKHYVRYVHKKAAYEHIPSKEEVYRIVDMTASLRDKTMFLMLFYSGIRINALCSLLYGHVKDQLDKDIIMLKITWDVDTKLRGTGIPFYITFINGEAAETLKQYCALKHKKSKPDTPLFYTRSKKSVSEKWVWDIMKKCLKRAGFDPKTMWTHSLRKAFRKIVRRAPIEDDDDREQLMGHKLKGSREAYFDRKDSQMISSAYQRCDFSREVPLSEMSKLRKNLEEQKVERLIDRKELENQLEEREHQIGELRGVIWDLKDAVASLEKRVEASEEKWQPTKEELEFIEESNRAWREEKEKKKG